MGAGGAEVGVGLGVGAGTGAVGGVWWVPGLGRRGGSWCGGGVGTVSEGVVCAGTVEGGPSVGRVGEV
jgi:hypothetical protein